MKSGGIGKGAWGLIWCGGATAWYRWRPLFKRRRCSHQSSLAVVSVCLSLSEFIIFEVCLRDVEEAVLVLVLFVDGGHERSGWREDLVHEDEDGLLGRKLDALADHVDELAHGQVGGDQVLLLIDGRDVRLLDLFADDLCGERRQ